MIIQFKTCFVDGDENVMVLDVHAKKIRFNRLTREIFLECEDPIELTKVVKKKKRAKKKVKP